MGQRPETQKTSITAGNLDVESIRSDFPVLSLLTYLDSASVAPCPLPVMEAITDYYTRQPFNYGVGAWRASRELTQSIDKAREHVASFVGAKSPSEIIFTKNTTEALNLVADGIRWAPGDEVLLTSLEHQSNLAPWIRQTNEHGIHVKILPVGADGVLEVNVVERNISKRTRLVGVTHVSNVLGGIQPVSQIGALTRSLNILFLVDAAQSAGRIPLNVDEIQCDFMAFCGRKALMGPQGIGFLFGRSAQLESLRPLQIGSRAANVIDEQRYELMPIPHRFEAGVLNAPGVLGLSSAIGYIEEIGLRTVRSRIGLLSKLLISELRNIPGLRLYAADDFENQAGIVSWNLRGIDSDDVARRLDQAASVVVASGAQGSGLAMRQLGVKGVVRTSVHIFNTEEEADRLVNAVRQITQAL